MNENWGDTMTFKHGKFEESVTMRSLVKVAEQKGWIKPEALQKTASSNLDLSPTTSLTENVIKLCAGLRKSGLHIYAEEVEKNYFTYKRANSLYDVSGEEGKDLINAAHPDGSHQMEDMDGDSVIETILDRHLKMVDVVEKKPSGKLANTKSILNAVKLVLGINSAQTNLNSLISEIINSLNSLVDQADEEITIPKNPLLMRSLRNDLTKATVYSLSEARESLINLISRYQPSAISGISDYTWKVLKPQFYGLVSKINKAIEIKKEYDNQVLNQSSISKENEISDGKERVGTDPYPNSTKLSQQIQKALGTINGYKASINADPDNDDAAKAQGNAWLDKKTQQINTIKASLNSNTDPEQQNITAESLLVTLQKITSGLASFQKQWIG